MTLNDVGLALVAGTLRRLALEVGEPPLALKAMVPVSLHPDDDRARFGNALSFAFLELPVDRADPADRLMLVHERTERFKAVTPPRGHGPGRRRPRRSSPPRCGPGWPAPPTARACSTSASPTCAARGGPSTCSARSSTRPTPSRRSGAEHALSVAFFTYRDGVHFAFQADPDVLGDVDGLPHALDAELDALADAFAPSRPPASRSAPVA